MAKVIKFYGDYCAPCKVMAPVFKEAVEELGLDAEEVNIGDAEGRNRAVENGIRSIPSFVAFNEQGSPFVLTGTFTKDELKEFFSNPQ